MYELGAMAGSATALLFVFIIWKAPGMSDRNKGRILTLAALAALAAFKIYVPTDYNAATEWVDKWMTLAVGLGVIMQLIAEILHK